LKLPPDLKIYGDTAHRDPNCRKEWVEQKEWFGLLKERRPQYYAVAVHPKNEGKRNGKQSAQDSEQGSLNAGASDILIPAGLSFVCEVKRIDHTMSSISADQLRYLRGARDLGSFACIALGSNAAWQALLDWEKLLWKNN
jgi:hypothetical protein